MRARISSTRIALTTLPLHILHVGKMKIVSTLYERNVFYQQLNVRYAMFMYVHSRVWKLQDLKTSKTKILTLLFLFVYMLDFVLGVLVAAIILFNPDIKKLIGHFLSLYTVTMLNWIGDYIDWLMGVPWGIKLNTPVNQFLGSHYLFILNLWRFFYSEFIAVYISLIVNFLVMLLPFGFTLSVTALHDFLKFLNLCLICFFVISHRISTLQISALKSLGRLFMGKKWNILKDRIDTCQYDINQLLVGTIIFTILLFLLPTTGMYTLAFLYLRLLQFSVQFALRICAVLVNKLTVIFVSYLHSCLLDQPITKMKVLIGGMDPIGYAVKEPGRAYEILEGTNCKLELFSFDDSDVAVLWNGKKYSLQEMREIVGDIPTEEIARQLDPKCHSAVIGNDLVERRVLNHSMLHWFWALPPS